MFLRQGDIAAIFLSVPPVDFRKGVAGLAALVDGEFTYKKAKKNLFVFTNKSKRKMRILYWDDNGFALWHKALEEEHFAWPKRSVTRLELSLEELKWLLSGVNLDKVKRHKKFSAKKIF